MAVGTGRSANQLHIYSKKGGGIAAMGGLVSESGWVLGLCWNTRPGHCTAARGACGRPAPCWKLPELLPARVHRKLELEGG